MKLKMMSEDIAKVRRSFQGPPGKNQCLLPYSCTRWQQKAQEAWSYSDNSNNTGNNNSLRLSSPSHAKHYSFFPFKSLQTH